MVRALALSIMRFFVCNSTAVADCPIGTREDPWGISNTWMFTFFCIGDVWNHSSYFCSVSFYGRSAGGRKAMKNSKITPFEHCNLDLTNLINAMQPAALKNWIFIWFKLWVQILSCDVMCKIHRFAPWRLRLPSVFCQCLCKLFRVRGSHSRKHLLRAFPRILHSIERFSV